MKAKPMIYLQWADATSPHDAWWTEEQALRWAKNDSYWIEQIGFLIEENRDYILLATSRSTTSSSDAPETEIQYGHLQKIPTTWIRNRKIIKP